MLFSYFTESQISRIKFYDNGITLQGLKVVNEFNKIGCLDYFSLEIVLELSSFVNKFYYQNMKSTYDQHMSDLVYNMHDAEIFIEYSFEENVELLAASYLQVFLRELPRSL